MFVFHSSGPYRGLHSFPTRRSSDLMAGEAEPITPRLRNGAAQLNPGRWDLQLVPTAGYVAVDFRGPKSERPENGHADGWNEITVTQSGSVKFVLSAKPGAIHGVVTGDLHEAA